MSSEQAYLLLSSDEEKATLEEQRTKERCNPDQAIPHKRWSFKIPLAIHVMLILCYIVALSHWWTSLQPSHFRSTQKYALAREALQYELTYFEDPTIAGALNSRAWLFAGRPRLELEAAWDDLLKNADIRVTNEEMGLLGREYQGMRLADGSGWYAQMAVHHNLHCLRGFHKFMNVNHYFPNITIEEYQLLQLHNVHCLDMLRQAVMCHGDTTPLTMTWDSKLQIAVANWSTPHECVSWDVLDGWAAERHVDVDAPGVVDIKKSDGDGRHWQTSSRVPVVIDFDG